MPDAATPENSFRQPKLRPVSRIASEPDPVVETTTAGPQLQRAISPASGPVNPGTVQQPNISRASERTARDKKPRPEAPQRKGDVGIIRRSRQLISEGRRLVSRKRRPPSQEIEEPMASVVKNQDPTPRSASKAHTKPSAPTPFQSVDTVDSPGEEAQIAKSVGSSESTLGARGVVQRSLDIASRATHMVFRQRAETTGSSPSASPIQETPPTTRTSLRRKSEETQPKPQHSKDAAEKRSPSSRDEDVTRAVESPEPVEKPSVRRVPLERSETHSNVTEDCGQEPSARRIEQAPPTLGIVQRSLNMASHARDMVFRKRVETASPSPAAGPTQGTPPTTRASLRRKSEETPAKPPRSRAVVEKQTSPEVKPADRSSVTSTDGVDVPLRRAPLERTEASPIASDDDSHLTPARHDAQGQPKSGIVRRTMGMASRAKDMVFRKQAEHGNSTPSASPTIEAQSAAEPSLRRQTGEAPAKPQRPRDVVEKQTSSEVKRADRSSEISADGVDLPLRRAPLERTELSPIAPDDDSRMTPARHDAQGQPRLGIVRRSMDVASRAKDMVFRKYVRIPSVTKDATADSTKPLPSVHMGRFSGGKRAAGKASENPSIERRKGMGVLASRMIRRVTRTRHGKGDAGKPIHGPGHRAETAEGKPSRHADARSQQPPKAVMTFRDQEDESTPHAVADVTAHSAADLALRREAAPDASKSEMPPSFSQPARGMKARTSDSMALQRRPMRSNKSKPEMPSTRQKTGVLRHLPVLRGTAIRRQPLSTGQDRKPMAVSRLTPDENAYQQQSYDSMERIHGERVQSSPGLPAIDQPPTKPRPTKLPLAQRAYIPSTSSSRESSNGGYIDISVPKSSKSLESKESGRRNGVVQRLSRPTASHAPVHSTEVSRNTLVYGPDSTDVIRRVSDSSDTEEVSNTVDVEFLALKIYSYIKNRLLVERERHGHPGFSLWR